MSKQNQKTGLKIGPMFKAPKWRTGAAKKDRAALEAQIAAFMPGHMIARPVHWRAGVIFASPHSGHLYPEAFIRQSSCETSQLRRNEDMFVERLMAPAISSGAPLLSAQFPRCYVDVNRRADEIVHPDIAPARQSSARAAAGLGVVPTHLTENQTIYSAPLTADEIEARLTALYYPYHAALQALIEESKALFGQVILLDCHSMPGFAPMGARRPDIILGDNFGKSCNPETIRLIQRIFEQAGYSVGVNYPYAGGHVTRHYGQPQDGAEVLQIEINRDLYLNPVTHARKSGYQRLADNLTLIVEQIIAAAEPMEIAAQ